MALRVAGVLRCFGVNVLFAEKEVYVLYLLVI